METNKRRSITTKRKWADLCGEAARLGVRVTDKRHWFWRNLGRVVRIFGNHGFCERYITTIGPVIAFPENWLATYSGTPEAVEILAHELEHVRQFKFFGLGSAWLGIPAMFLLYTLVPVPVGLALGRYWIERRAYLAGYRALIDIGERPNYQHAMRELTGPQYGWCMWLYPSTVRKYFDRKIGSQI